MARQSTTPVSFQRTRRADNRVTMSSGDPGQVIPVSYAPLLRGDSCAGRIGIDIDLAEMPRPLLNSVVANVQAWFVPKSAFPQFASYEEFQAAYNGTVIKALGQADRNPPPLASMVVQPADPDVFASTNPLAKTLGVHVVPGKDYNMDLQDAYNLIWNFRAAAHSSRIARRKYSAEDILAAVSVAPAFWPANRFSAIVPDYDQALVVGDLALDVSAGAVNVTTNGVSLENFFRTATQAKQAGEVWDTHDVPAPAGNYDALWKRSGVDLVAQLGQITGSLDGSTVNVSLANIDKARETQAFAKLRAAYAGNDPTGFANDDAILADLMRGFSVPEDAFKRPWLLDSQIVTFGMVERHATDAANLDASVTRGRASATLALNVPEQDSGGYILVTVEVMPERIDERQTDVMFLHSDGSQFPDALRDVQRIEPVDIVPNYRLDARHALPDALYGYEPMNDVWRNRSFTSLGGSFYQSNPSNPWTEQRSAIWQPSVVNREFNSDHFLCPQPFPKYVFSDTVAPAFEFVARHTLTVSGLTQFGDVLLEDNGEYLAVQDAQV